MGSTSRLDGCGQFMKYILFFFNLLVFLGGLAVTALGIWTLTGHTSFETLLGSNLYVAAAGLLVAIGAIVTFISFLGCCGAIKEVRCLLGTFFVIMLLLTILIILGAAFGLTLKEKLGENLENSLKETIKKYGDGIEQKPIKEAWDEMQKGLKCCGAHDWTDWQQNLNYPTIPKSCCDPSIPSCDTTKATRAGLFDKGCFVELEQYIKTHATPLAAVGITLAVIIVLSMIFSCALCMMV